MEIQAHEKTCYCEVIDGQIKFCALHKAAPKMYVALVQAERRLRAIGRIVTGRDGVSDPAVVCRSVYNAAYPGEASIVLDDVMAQASKAGQGEALPLVPAIGFE